MLEVLQSQREHAEYMKFLILHFEESLHNSFFKTIKLI
jgi:hypothetical protein